MLKTVYSNAYEILEAYLTAEVTTDKKASAKHPSSIWLRLFYGTGRHLLVPVVGVEPTRYRYHWILSPARLPIPSYRHESKFIISHFCDKIKHFFIFSQKNKKRKLQ